MVVGSGPPIVTKVSYVAVGVISDEFKATGVGGHIDVIIFDEDINMAQLLAPERFNLSKDTMKGRSVLFVDKEIVDKYPKIGIRPMGTHGEADVWFDPDASISRKWKLAGFIEKRALELPHRFVYKDDLETIQDIPDHLVSIPDGTLLDDDKYIDVYMDRDVVSKFERDGLMVGVGVLVLSRDVPDDWTPTAIEYIDTGTMVIPLAQPTDPVK
jgi:hypothetical protein